MPAKASDALPRRRDQQVLVRAVLLAAVVAVRHPDQRHAEMVDEDVARQPARAVRDDLHPLAERALHALLRPEHPGMVRARCGWRPCGRRRSRSHLGEALRRPGGGAARPRSSPGRYRRCSGSGSGAGIGGHGVHRVLRPAGQHRQHDEAVPAIDLLGRRSGRARPNRRRSWPRRRRRPTGQPASTPRTSAGTPLRGSQSRTRILPWRSMMAGDGVG